MTALSIAEAERRAAANPQVSRVRRRVIRADGDLASVTELTGAVRRKCEADPEISRRAGVSRTAGVSRRAAAPAPAGVSRAGVSRRAAAPAPAGVSRTGVSRPGQPAPAGVSRRAEVPGAAAAHLRSADLTAGAEARRAGPPSSSATAGQPGVLEVRGRPGGLGLVAHGRARVAPGPVRLTSRGRAVVAGLAAAVAVSVCSLLAAGGAAAASHGSPGAGYPGMHQVVVERGQTLWSIASAAEPTADPQAVVQQIVTANALAGSTIHAGQVLWVPRG